MECRVAFGKPDFVLYRVCLVLALGGECGVVFIVSVRRVLGSEKGRD